MQFPSDTFCHYRLPMPPRSRRSRPQAAPPRTMIQPRPATSTWWCCRFGLLRALKAIANRNGISHIGLDLRAERRREHHRAAVRRGELHPRVIVSLGATGLLHCAHHGAPSRCTALELPTQTQRRAHEAQQEHHATCGQDDGPHVSAEQIRLPDPQEDASDDQIADQAGTATDRERYSCHRDHPCCLWASLC
jgi:hypothetical protein